MEDSKIAQRVAIVGGGASGLLTAIHLLRRGSSGLVVSVFEPNELGAGLAYGTRDESHLLNVPAHRMGIDDENPGEFLTFLKETFGEVEKVFSHYPFVPRTFYRDYLQWELDRARKESPATFEWVKARVGRFENIGSRGWQLCVAGGSQYQCDVLVLATGYRELTPLKGKFNERFQPCSTFEVSQMAGAKKVLIIGTGLSAVDVYRSIRKVNPHTQITFLSRHGNFPLPHWEGTALHLPKIPHLAGLSPLGVFKFMRTVCRPQNQGMSWQLWIDGLRPQIPMLWQTWTLGEQAQFCRHLKPYWEIARHRVPASVWKEMEGEFRQGSCINLKGRIKAIEANSSGVKVSWKKAEMAESQSFDFVVQATGSSANNLDKEQLSSLGLSPDVLGFGFYPDHQNTLFVVGPPAKATYWEITAVPEIRRQALAVSQRILDKDFGSCSDLFDRAFFSHAATVGESYGEHAREALKLAQGMFLSAFFTAVHSVFPFLFKSDGSRILIEKYRAVRGRYRTCARLKSQQIHPKKTGRLKEKIKKLAS